jgi:hypothetical protein
MAVDGIANLVQNLAHQIFRQRRETQAETHTLGTGHAGNKAEDEDIFTSSAQNHSAQATAQDAGLFQVSQVALTEVTANVLFGLSTAGANQHGAPAQAAPAPTTNADAAQTAAATNTIAPVNAGQLFAATPAAQTATGAAPDSQNLEVQLQTLNAALPALGLSNAEIQQIDRIAKLIHDFNPAAFTNLVKQFEALAQQVAQQSAANSAAAAGTIATTNAGISANGGGFQVQEIFIHFTGLQETVNNAATIGGGQGATANSFQITAASLQIEEVQITLANGNGQTAQVRAPQQTTSAGTTNQQAPQILTAA